MAHLLFLIALNLLFHAREDGQHGHRRQRDDQHQHDQHVTALPIL